MYPYARHHNPFTFFTDVLDSPQLRQNLVPYSQFADDLAAGQVPQFSFIVPNQLHNAHDGTLAQADQWLERNISPILNSAAFQADALLILLWDESYTTDDRSSGGRVAVVVCSPQAKAGYRSTTFYQHQSTLKLVLQALGVSDLPGASNGAPGMDEFFMGGSQGCLPEAPGVKICAPAAGGTVDSPVEVKTRTITGIRVYVDNVALYFEANDTAAAVV